jgi:hypothetical protein
MSVLGIMLSVLSLITTAATGAFVPDTLLTDCAAGTVTAVSGADAAGAIREVDDSKALCLTDQIKTGRQLRRPACS